jgi:hypothetical protein
MTDKLVTIAQFANYIEAEMAKQLLEDYGIKAIMSGQYTSIVYPILAVGPKLQVLQSQAEQAKEILESHRKSVDAAPNDTQEQ